VDNPQNVISFCTGYGGLELGIRRAGVDVRTIVNVEIEAFVQANILAKIEEGRMDDAASWTDLKTFPASIFRGKIHGITCGYPCQPFSSAGKRKGEEDPRHLWPYIRRHIRAIGPSWVFAENVRGHTSMGLWRVLSDLEEDGYRTEWGLFSAEETGAPHQRIRCFILAKLPDTCGKGLQGYEFGGTRSSQVEGIQGTHESTSELHQVRDGQLGNPASLRPHRGRENREGEQSEVLGAGLESDGELAHPASREPRQPQARNGGQDIGGGSEDTQWPARPGEEQYEWEEPRVVVDSKESRLQGCREPHTEDGRECEKDGAEVLSRAANSSSHEGVSESKESTGETQSELGGAVDGSACGVDATANRVDRLRLLGNGVIPQTAEIAWKTLWEKLSEQS